MFIGAVPKEVVGQVLATVPFDEWGSVYVGCSGSFRFDRAVKMRHPTCRVFSNDVSLLTCSIGALAMGREFPIRFKGALEFVEPAIEGLDFRGRVAAVMVACAMGQFTGKNEYAQVHYRHYREHFRMFVDQALPKLAALGITRPKYEELTIVFLPEEKAAFIDLVARLEKSKKAEVLVGELGTFNTLFDAIVRVKQEKKVINNAIALRLLAELAVRALDAEKLAEPIVPEAAPARKRKVA